MPEISNPRVVTIQLLEHLCPWVTLASGHHIQVAVRFLIDVIFCELSYLLVRAELWRRKFIMPAYDVIAKGIRISGAFERQFSHSIIVRTPRQIERGLQQNNWFLREVMSKGKVLYEARNGSVNPEGTCRTAACVRTASAASTSQIHLGSRRARSLMILARDRRIEELA
jgi:hypothetical protein